MTLEVDPGNTIPFGYPKDTDELERQSIETRLEQVPLGEFFDSATGELSHEGEMLVAVGLALLTQSVFTLVESKGFHDSGRSFGEEVGLIHSEVSEALEEWRSGKSNTYYRFDKGKPTEGFSAEPYDERWPGQIGKGEGIVTELADAIIREVDSAKGMTVRHSSSECNKNIALALIYKLRYNATREHMHGKSA